MATIKESLGDCNGALTLYRKVCMMDRRRGGGRRWRWTGKRRREEIEVSGRLTESIFLPGPGHQAENSPSLAVHCGFLVQHGDSLREGELSSFLLAARGLSKQQTGQLDEARRVCERSLEISTQCLGRDHPNTRDARELLKDLMEQRAMGGKTSKR